jgi:sugar transferase (PEP-CTERM/EpsH1 system associated)
LKSRTRPSSRSGTLTRRLKIAHVVHSLELGGLENGLVNLLNILDPERFEHSVICLTRAGSFAERISNRVAIIEIGAADNSFRFPLLKLSRLFRERGPDVVHTRGWGAVDAVFAARCAGVQAVIHGEHGREWTDTDGTNWKRNQIRRVVGYLVKHYVVVSDFFRPWLMGNCGVSCDKIVYIPNGVDTRRFGPLPSSDSGRERGGLRARLGLPAEGVLIGSVGRLDPVKDIPTLLRSFAKLVRDHPEARLAIVGDGPLRGELETLSHALNIECAVTWLGRRDDVPALLQCFDLFVQCSLFEGMSNTILEAMATGLPIVATDTGGNSELVEQNRNGFLFPVGNVVTLTDLLGRYLKDFSLHKDHAFQSRRRAMEQFDIGLMAGRYADLYLGSC